MFKVGKRGVSLGPRLLVSLDFENVDLEACNFVQLYEPYLFENVKNNLKFND